MQKEQRWELQLSVLQPYSGTVVCVLYHLFTAPSVHFTEEVSNQYFMVRLKDHFYAASPADHLGNRLLFFPILLLSPVLTTSLACEVQICPLWKIMISRMLLSILSQVGLAKQLTPSTQMFCWAYTLRKRGRY